MRECDSCGFQTVKALTLKISIIEREREILLCAGCGMTLQRVLALDDLAPALEALIEDAARVEAATPD
jgi:hypothetical protein